jgi:hypothetical protein
VEHLIGLLDPPGVDQHQRAERRARLLSNIAAILNSAYYLVAHRLASFDRSPSRDTSCSTTDYDTPKANNIDVRHRPSTARALG